MLTLFLYKLLGYVCLPLLWLRLWLRGLREPAYRLRRRERLGYIPANVKPGCIWFHCVSAGETIGSAQLIAEIVKQYPQQPLLVTTTTPTGSAEVIRRLGDSVDHCYIPYDLSPAVTRFLNAVQPVALFLMETELWPVLINDLQTRRIPVHLVNARLSEKSAHGYRKIHHLTKRMLSVLTGVACQYEDTATRLVDLGLAREKVNVTGNIKFDIELPANARSEIDALRSSWCDSRQVWIAASTHPGEDGIVLDAHKIVQDELPDALLILVPRHPHRTRHVKQMARERRLTAALLSSEPERVNVLIVDQIGVLLLLYGLAEVAFIGGSLDKTGGHNVIEAAIHGIPCLMGPNRQNFEEVANRFENVGCLHEVHDKLSIAQLVLSLLKDPSEQQRQGRLALNVVELNRGAQQRLQNLVCAWVDRASSHSSS